MFRRVIIEDWHQYLPLIGFVLTLAVFLVMLLRALLMRRERCQALAQLPLEEPEWAAPASPAMRPPCNGQCAECRCARDNLLSAPKPPLTDPS
ncbi:hypothetical protein DES53_102854 [Roseimicrobium gellanilyticum]|uniref:Uncharacterized protein n=1 Tax=Roseimicrobium gellanilyticum TaxID=748857 RepID=A0A366HU50_9BACT|nr:hypothetical protein [Roseimicrobium gellanilyticum]RBP46463.1 hypothetical protein DES53_102854 [Roseimicrobium gellanilyticum]